MALGIRLVDLMPKLLLIDGDNLAYRCFLARQNSPTGLLVNSAWFKSGLQNKKELTA